MDSLYLTVCDVWSTVDCHNVNFAYDPSTLPPDLRLAASSQHDRSNPRVAGSYSRLMWQWAAVVGVCQAIEGSPGPRVPGAAARASPPPCVIARACDSH